MICFALCGTNGIPTCLSLFTVPQWGGFPISSLLVAKLSMTNWFAMPREFTLWVNTLSQRGERQMLPWQMNKILIFLIFPVFSGFSSLFTFLHFSLFLAYFGISLHIFVINFGKNFGKFQVCTKGKSTIGNRQVRIAYFMPSYQNYLALLCFHLRCQSFLHYLMLFSPR